MKFGNHIEELQINFGDDQSTKAACLRELKKHQERLSREKRGRLEIFDFGSDLSFLDADTVEKRLALFVEVCVWHAIALKAEFKLKLLHTIDGYLSAVDAKNPVSTFLLARYLLELVATVSEIDFLLEGCAEQDIDEWKLRAANFLSVLYRARHSTSHDEFKAALIKNGFSEEHLAPIKMKNAIKRLATREGFSGAHWAYRMLSNMCHHNGSGHKMFAESVRLTNAIASRRGDLLVARRKTAAITLNYPSERFASNALGITARVASWSAHSADRIIADLRESPFDDFELRTISKNRIKSVAQCLDPAFTEREKETPKVGRNEPCPCGSGKKYKICCGKPDK